MYTVWPGLVTPLLALRLRLRVAARHIALLHPCLSRIVQYSTMAYHRAVCCQLTCLRNWHLRPPSSLNEACALQGVRRLRHHTHKQRRQMRQHLALTSVASADQGNLRRQAVLPMRHCVRLLDATAAAPKLEASDHVLSTWRSAQVIMAWHSKSI